MSEALSLEDLDRLVRLAADLPSPVKPWRAPNGRDYYLIVPHPAAVEAAFRGAHPSRLMATVRDDGSWAVVVFLGDDEDEPALMASPDVVAKLRGCTVEQLAKDLEVVLGRPQPAEDQRPAGPDEGA
jgi:hypothetical protein